jgi:hypothetical protein
MFDKLKCRFGCDDPIGIYHAPEGCICWPDKIQALCPQHVIKARNNGVEIEPIVMRHFDIKSGSREE